jgi:cytosine deaminase
MKEIEVEVLHDLDCFEMMQDFIKARPDLWHEDIGAKSLRTGFSDAPRY